MFYVIRSSLREHNSRFQMIELQLCDVIIIRLFLEMQLLFCPWILDSGVLFKDFPRICLRNLLICKDRLDLEQLFRFIANFCWKLECGGFYQRVIHQNVLWIKLTIFKLFLSKIILNIDHENPVILDVKVLFINDLDLFDRSFVQLMLRLIYLRFYQLFYFFGTILNFGFLSRRPCWSQFGSLAWSEVFLHNCDLIYLDFNWSFTNLNGSYVLRNIQHWVMLLSFLL